MSYFLAKPEILKVSLTNICNYRCVMCFNPGMRQERGRMPAEKLRRIVDQCVDAGVGKMALGATGEPLLHPEFPALLAYAKSRGLWVSTTTNASRLVPELGAELLGLGIDRVNLSVYSTSDQEHRNYTGTALFPQVLDNIRAFLRLWKERGRPCVVNMWFLPIPGVNSLETHLAFWKPLADEVGLEITHQPMLTWGGSVGDAPNPRPRLVRRDRRLALRWLHRRPCPDLRYYLHVLHTGEVLPCCQVAEPDPEGHLVFGRLPEDTIEKIWTSERYLRLKRAHAARRVAGYPACPNCAQVWEPRQLSVPAW